MEISSILAQGDMCCLSWITTHGFKEEVFVKQTLARFTSIAYKKYRSECVTSSHSHIPPRPGNVYVLSFSRKQQSTNKLLFHKREKIIKGHLSTVGTLHGQWRHHDSQIAVDVLQNGFRIFLLVTHCVNDKPVQMNSHKRKKNWRTFKL